MTTKVASSFIPFGERNGTPQGLSVHVMVYPDITSTETSKHQVVFSLRYGTEEVEGVNERVDPTNVAKAKKARELIAQQMLKPLGIDVVDKGEPFGDALLFSVTQLSVSPGELFEVVKRSLLGYRVEKDGVVGRNGGFYRIERKEMFAAAFDQVDAALAAENANAPTVQISAADMSREKVLRALKAAGFPDVAKLNKEELDAIGRALNKERREGAAAARTGRPGGRY